MTARGTLVINADDLGANPEANERIIRCLRDGLITSATIMANMPEFDAAVAAALEAGVADRIGVHLNLDTGPALSTEMRALSPDGNLFCDRRLVILNGQLRHAIYCELRAQAEKVRRAGINPTHFDSHHHLHTHFSITLAVLRLAGELDVPFVRLAGNLYFPKSRAKQTYRNFINALIRRRGRAGTRYFTYVDRFLPHCPDLGASSAELMTHPELDTDYTLLHSPEYKRLLESYRLVGYAELAKT